ncbi:MAG: nickel-dependent hydrogenase large subunit, partial [Actinomycetota bacterium]
ADFTVQGAAPRNLSPRSDQRERAGSKVFNIDPVTRIAGALAFRTEVDLAEGVVTEAHSEAVLFRGYELILKGRTPLDAIDISSRACGVCGGVHSTCAAMTLEMIYGVTPPPLALIARNLAEAAELLYDHSLHLFLLAGPDYSEKMVARTNPKLWARAERTAAAGAGTHGIMTIGEIMTALNPLTGSLYREALEATRGAREIVSLIFGKYPHPSAIVPAGLGTKLDHSTLNQVLARMVRLLDYAKRVAALWEDMVEFFYEADPRYRQVGVRQSNLITIGLWDDPSVYDASYVNADAWGIKRYSTPGVVVDGELRTTALNRINLGIEEFVEHSFYEAWTDGSNVAYAPDGSPVSPFHPWNKETIAKPESRGLRERYSWATSPRWDRETMESGPLARQWVTAEMGLVQTSFIRSGHGRLEITIPQGTLPETTITWEIPHVVNAFERNRARSVHIAYCLMTAYNFLLQGFDLLRVGETEMSRPYEQRDGVGVGYWEAGRGILTHHARIEDGVLANYQILTPSTWMAGPRDPWGTPGPYEEAILNTPILEENRGEDFEGIDILRAIRSFDPCMPCAVHMHTGHGEIVRDATTCACGDG